MAEHHLRLTYRLPASLEEEWVAALWEAGTLGVQTLPETVAGEARIEAWFALPEPALDEAAWHHRGLRREGAQEIEASDWLAHWRRLAKPQPAGTRFLLDPREPADAEAEVEDEERTRGRKRGTSARILLRLPARNAFGSGSHESTRLALELLEARSQRGMADAAVLDVGTGTGVLAFAALALGARWVVGFDIDPVSPFQARVNGRLNAPVLADGRFVCFAGGIAALCPGVRFDLALVNVLPGRIMADLPAIADRLAEGGDLIFSGIVEEQVAKVVDDCARLGLILTQCRSDGEWVALSFRRLSFLPSDSLRSLLGSVLGIEELTTLTDASQGSLEPRRG